MQYSVDRCMEEVCRNEPFEIYDYGFGGPTSITADELTKHYRNMIETFPLQIYGWQHNGRRDGRVTGCCPTFAHRYLVLRNGFAKKDRAGAGRLLKR